MAAHSYPFSLQSYPSGFLTTEGAGGEVGVLSLTGVLPVFKAVEGAHIRESRASGGGGGMIWIGATGWGSKVEA